MTLNEHQKLRRFGKLGTLKKPRITLGDSKSKLTKEDTDANLLMVQKAKLHQTLVTQIGTTIRPTVCAEDKHGAAMMVLRQIRVLLVKMDLRELSKDRNTVVKIYADAQFTIKQDKNNMDCFDVTWNNDKLVKMLEEKTMKTKRDIQESRIATRTFPREHVILEWQGPLRDNYDMDYDQFLEYDELYDISRRLGFNSAEDAWLTNPIIFISTDPSELRVVKRSRQLVEAKTRTIKHPRNRQK